MVQSVAATTQGAEQVTIGEMELGAGPILPGTQTALVGSGGGAEVWLDGEQMGTVYEIKTESARWLSGLPPQQPLLWGLRQESRGEGPPHLLCWA